MRPGNHLRSWGAGVLFAAGAWLALGAGGAADSLEALRQSSQEVRRQLTAEKARVLREDPEAVALRERIEKLYRELDRLVSAQPSVVRLQADLARLEETLKAKTPATAGTRSPGGAKP